MDDKILTLHPEGKNGVRISLKKYTQVKDLILELVEDAETITFQELCRVGRGVLEKENFEGSPMWYITSVKLDLEAREIIERVPKTSPHVLKLTEKK